MSSDVNLCQIFLELHGGRYQDKRPNHRARSRSDELHRLLSAVRPEGHSSLPPQRVGFLHRFGLKTGIYFAHFCPWNRVWFTTGTTVEYQCVRRFISKINKKESGICEIEMDFSGGF